MGQYHLECIDALVPMQPDDVRLVRAYLRTREVDSPYLFVSTRGIPLERRSYWDVMQQYGQVAGIPKAKRRFHALRHTIAVHLPDAGADVAFVQDRLGHANIQNTMGTGATPRSPAMPRHGSCVPVIVWSA